MPGSGSRRACCYQNLVENSGTSSHDHYGKKCFGSTPDNPYAIKCPVVPGVPVSLDVFFYRIDAGYDDQACGCINHSGPHPDEKFSTSFGQYYHKWADTYGRRGTSVFLSPEKKAVSIPVWVKKDYNVDNAFRSIVFGSGMSSKLSDQRRWPVKYVGDLEENGQTYRRYIGTQAIPMADQFWATYHGHGCGGADEDGPIQTIVDKPLKGRKPREWHYEQNENQLIYNHLRYVFDWFDHSRKGSYVPITNGSGRKLSAWLDVVVDLTSDCTKIHSILLKDRHGGPYFFFRGEGELDNEGDPLSDVPIFDRCDTITTCTYGEGYGKPTERWGAAAKTGYATVMTNVRPKSMKVTIVDSGTQCEYCLDITSGMKSDLSMPSDAAYFVPQTFTAAGTYVASYIGEVPAGDTTIAANRQQEYDDCTTHLYRTSAFNWGMGHLYTSEEGYVNCHPSTVHEDRDFVLRDSLNVYMRYRNGRWESWTQPTLGHWESLVCGLNHDNYHAIGCPTAPHLRNCATVALANDCDGDTYHDQLNLRYGATEHGVTTVNELY